MLAQFCCTVSAWAGSASTQADPRAQPYARPARASCLPGLMDWPCCSGILEGFETSKEEEGDSKTYNIERAIMFGFSFKSLLMCLYTCMCTCV